MKIIYIFPPLGHAGRQVRVLAKKYLIVFCSFALLCSLLLTVMLLNMKGVASRVYFEHHDLSEGTAQVYFVKTAQDLISFYQARHIYGRVLLSISNRLHFRNIGTEEILKTEDKGKFPIVKLETIKNYQQRITPENVLWVSLQFNIFREFYHLLPDDEFDARVSAVRITDPEIISISNDSIVAHERGAKRIVSKSIGRFSEPVLLNVDASYFTSSDPESLVDDLKKAELSVDFITLNLSEDVPEITAVERNKLKKFALLISKGDIQ